MRVIVNELSALNVKAGVGHYTNQMVRALRARAGSDVIDAFPAGLTRDLARACYRARPLINPQKGQETTGNRASWVGDVKGRITQGLRRTVQEFLAWRFRRVTNYSHYDVYFEPNYIPLPCDTPTVTTVHDLSVLLHPDWHPADRVAHHERYFATALDRSAHFLAVSEFTRQEMIRHLGVAPERVTRVHNGVRATMRPLPPEQVEATIMRLGLPRDYLLSVGTIEPRKNLLMLMRAYVSLPPSVRARWPLLLVGNWGWMSGAEAEYLQTTARHQGVIHLGYLADADLAAVLNRARALVYPSLYEGFGFPPLEMMACGGAVLTSTAGSIRETAGGQAHLIDPADVEGWRAAMQRVLTDRDWWMSLRRGAIAHARRYTWEHAADEALIVFRSLSNRSDKVPLAA
jgi:alpha-1,3-rhamnosyl/mannosyltransferase